MDVVLQWHGPFSVVEGTSLPYLFDSATEQANWPGVYLWTIQCDGEELVHYVGKAERPFRTRLGEEFKEDRNPDWDWIPDPEKLQQGIKEWLYEPYGLRKPDLKKWKENEAFFIECWKRYLAIIRIFIAPMPKYSGQEITDTETALMWAVWDHAVATGISENQVGYILTNGPRFPSRLQDYRVRMTTSARFRGLGETIP